MFAVVYVLAANVAVCVGIRDVAHTYHVDLLMYSMLMYITLINSSLKHAEPLVFRSATPIIVLFKIKNVDINITRNMINCL